MVLYTCSTEGSAISGPFRNWLPSPPGTGLGVQVLCSPLWVLMINHVLAAGCQLVDGLGVVGQGLFQYLMLLHLCLGTQLVLGEGRVAAESRGRGEESRSLSSGLALTLAFSWPIMCNSCSPIQASASAASR